MLGAEGRGLDRVGVAAVAVAVAGALDPNVVVALVLVDFEALLANDRDDWGYSWTYSSRRSPWFRR